MSEARPNSRNVHTPHSTEELYGYFKAKEEAEPSRYKGYSDAVAEIADAIEKVRTQTRSSEPLAIDLALIPGRSRGIYTHEQTDASRELMELIFSANGLEPVADETTAELPYGRTLWQNVDYAGPINLIETRKMDTQGEFVRLTVVTDVPEDLLYAKPIHREYSYEDRKAMIRARSAQNDGNANPHEVAEAKIDFYQFVNDWPVTTDGVPAEELDIPLTD